MKRLVSFFGEQSPVFDDLNNRAKAHAAKYGIEYVWTPQVPYNKAAVIEALKTAEAGIIDIEPYDDSVFSAVQGKTELLVRFGVGYDKVDLQAATRRGIAIARTPGANTLGVAEMALSLILAARRRFPVNMNSVAQGRWEKNVVHETIGSTVGIVGFGQIGQALAKLLTGFECQILVYDPFPNKAANQRLGVKSVSLEELFALSDAVSLHLPYAAETHNLIDSALLSRMKPSAVIVNTSRGNIIDELALFQSLKERQIAGAGLDVFGTEPLPLDSPLLTLENIILTPHVSSQTVESLWRIYEMAIDITSDFFAGRVCPQILNPSYKDGHR